MLGDLTCWSGWRRWSPLPRTRTSMWLWPAQQQGTALLHLRYSSLQEIEQGKILFIWFWVTRYIRSIGTKTMALTFLGAKIRMTARYMIRGKTMINTCNITTGTCNNFQNKPIAFVCTCISLKASGILHPSWQDSRSRGIKFCSWGIGKPQKTSSSRS